MVVEVGRRLKMENDLETSDIKEGLSEFERLWEEMMSPKGRESKGYALTKEDFEHKINSIMNAKPEPYQPPAWYIPSNRFEEMVRDNYIRKDENGEYRMTAKLYRLMGPPYPALLGVTILPE